MVRIIRIRIQEHQNSKHYGDMTRISLDMVVSWEWRDNEVLVITDQNLWVEPEKG